MELTETQMYGLVGGVIVACVLMYLCDILYRNYIFARDSCLSLDELPEQGKEIMVNGHVTNIREYEAGDLPGYSPYGDDYSPAVCEVRTITYGSRQATYRTYRTYFASPYNDEWRPGPVGTAVRVIMRRQRVFFKTRWAPCRMESAA